MTKRIKFILFTLFFSPSLFLINYYQSINMKKDEYPDYIFWTLYLLVVVCLTVICRSVRQILFSVVCMSAVSVGLGYWLIEKIEGESIVHESKKKICLSSRRADGHILFRLHV